MDEIISKRSNNTSEWSIKFFKNAFEKSQIFILHNKCLREKKSDEYANW